MVISAETSYDIPVWQAVEERMVGPGGFGLMVIARQSSHNRTLAKELLYTRPLRDVTEAFDIQFEIFIYAYTSWASRVGLSSCQEISSVVA